MSAPCATCHDTGTISPTFGGELLGPCPACRGASAAPDAYGMRVARAVMEACVGELSNPVYRMAQDKLRRLALKDIVAGVVR